eukprot:845728-Prorocentrum_minimum.AAC.5
MLSGIFMRGRARWSRRQRRRSDLKIKLINQIYQMTTTCRPTLCPTANQCFLFRPVLPQWVTTHIHVSHFNSVTTERQLPGERILDEFWMKLENSQEFWSSLKFGVQKFIQNSPVPMFLAPHRLHRWRRLDVGSAGTG